MSHTLNCVWVHVVFGTAERHPWIQERLHNRLHGYLRAVLDDLGCPVTASNGMADHVHILFLLDSGQSLGNVMSKTKANSARWLKKLEPGLHGFAWQPGYAAFAVSPTLKPRVISYIEHQEQHHRLRTFVEEYEELLRLGEQALQSK